MFQMSGQGPYFGQAAWFNNYNPEKVPSAIERYGKEIERVTMALNNALEGKEYLVGDKCTYADLAFVTWAAIAPYACGPHEINWDAYPNYNAWVKRLTERPAVKKVLEDKKKAMGQGH